MVTRKRFRSNALYLFCIAILCIMVSFPLPAAEAAPPDESAACLECHAQKGLVVIFQNREKVEAFVDIEKFKGSVHASLGCSSCHAEFSRSSHPERTFRSRQHYSEKAAQICRQCHTDEQIRKSPIHASLLDRSEGTPVCSSCHSAHAIAPRAGGRKFSSEKQYCMSCHAQHLSLKFTNGETVSLRVDPAVLEQSVHARLGCYDCHFGFSLTQHPRRNFATSRNFSITQSETCRRCHFDKYTKTIESIHFTLLSQGRLDAPVCTDCHGTHGITLAVKDKSEGARRCGACHKEIFATYASSVHGNAMISSKNADVPVCIDCHTAHTIEHAHEVDYRDKVPDICGRCHGDKRIMKKYGLNPGVVNSYLQDFHGVTLTFYKKQKGSPAAANRRSIATCTDCHGIHDIAKTSGADAKAMKAKLTRRCQKCHAGATEEFPDTWLSHYEPTLTNAPLVFAINLIYTVFIPFMLIGLVLQILLHLWRYTVNR